MPDETLVALLTQHHRYVGEIRTEGQRLQELFLDKLTDYVHIFDAKVFQHTDQTICIDEQPEIVLRKAAVNMVLIFAKEHEAPQKRLNSYVPKAPFPIFLTMPGHEVRGSIYLSSVPHTIVAPIVESGDFFAVTQAVVSRVGETSAPLDVQVLLVNTAWIEAVAIGKTPLSSKNLEETCDSATAQDHPFCASLTSRPADIGA